MISNHRKTRGIHLRGTRAIQPVYTAVLEGTLYYVSDESVLEIAGTAGWEDVSAVTVMTPGGSDGELQFNDAGVLDGAPGIIYDPALNSLTLAGNFISVGNKTAGGITATTHGAAADLFTMPHAGVFLVHVYLAGSFDPVNYNAFATIITEGNVARIANSSMGAISVITISGMIVRITQSSGSPQNMTWQYLRII